MTLLTFSKWPPSYQVKRHHRAKHIRLKISEPQNLVITLPSRHHINEVPFILEKYKDWIQKHFANLSPPWLETLPERIELRACKETWRINYIKGANKKIKILSRSHLNEIALVGSIDDVFSCRSKLLCWVKARAKLYLPNLLNHFSNIMKLPYNKVTIRNQKTRWGSCSVDKSINLNYKLIFLPSHLVSHVLIHELGHLVHHNHSSKFWNLVANHDERWRIHRSELRQTQRYIPSWVIGKW